MMTEVGKRCTAKKVERELELIEWGNKRNSIMRHGDMARRWNISKKTLSTLMARLIQSGKVEPYSLEVLPVCNKPTKTPEAQLFAESLFRGRGVKGVVILVEDGQRVTRFTVARDLTQVIGILNVAQATALKEKV